jgi:Transmembrane protein 33/Nucleoporin POM33
MANAGFENFDFSKSSEWIAYYQNIFPPPDYTRLLKIKQKWYKQRIDPNYSPDVPSAGPNPSIPPNSRPANAGQSSARTGSGTGAVSVMQKLQVLLFILSIPGMLIGKSLHLIIAGHLAGIIHYHDMPKLTLEYWQPVLTDDNLHSIAFALIFLMVPSSFLWVVPVYLSVSVYIGNFATRYSGLPASIKTLGRKIDSKKLLILQSRADTEVWLGFAMIFLTLVGYMHWITPIIYWQYTRVRYSLNYFSKTSFSNLKVKGDKLFTGKPGIQTVWVKIIQLCNWMTTVDVNSSPSCQIF